MASPGHAANASEPDRRSPFRRVLCAVNGTRASDEAARQALAVVHPAGVVTFLAVTDERGDRHVAQASLGERRARRAARKAQEAAMESGFVARAEVLWSDDPRRAIVDAACNFDLLVLGAHGRSRAAGILLGSTASFAVHASPVPVLVARVRQGGAFPGTVVAGTAGAGDLRTCAVAARLAASCGSPVMLGHVRDDRSRTARRALALQGAALIDITGSEPVVLSATGNRVDALVAMAESAAAGLLVVGSRARPGVAALASVSERAAHRAPCSVLVLRATQGRRAAIA